MITGAALAFYIIGLLVFLTWGKVSNTWADWFYLWDKCKDLFFLTCIYLLIEKRHKWIVKIVIAYATIRVLWEIITMIWGFSVNNAVVVGWLFILLASVCSFIILKELFKWRR